MPVMVKYKQYTQLSHRPDVGFVSFDSRGFAYVQSNDGRGDA